MPTGATAVGYTYEVAGGIVPGRSPAGCQHRWWQTQRF